MSVGGRDQQRPQGRHTSIGADSFHHSVLGNLVAGLRSKPAVCMVLPAKPEVRTHRNKVYVQTLIASTVFAQTVASKVFKVYAPALRGGGVSCKVLLRWG